MEVRGSKIRVNAYYKEKRYTRTFDLEEYRKKGFDSWLLAQSIIGDLGPELIGTTLTFGAGESGLWRLLNAFLANALIRGYFKTMDGLVKLQVNVNVDVSIEPVIETHHIKE